MNFSQNVGTSERVARWFTPAMLLGVAAYLYANLFYLPGVPFLLSGDQVYFWMDAQRMLHGERIYRDFFQFTSPGTDLVYLVLFKFFGVRICVPNWTVLLLGIALCWVCFRIARQILDRHLSLLATLLFLTLIYGRLLNGTHHWFSMLAVMCALIVLARKADGKGAIATAGLLLGVASFFTQTHGAVAAFAFTVFLIWDRARAKIPSRKILADLALLWAGYMTSLVILEAHFIEAVGLGQLWYFQVRYVSKYMVHGFHTPLLGLPELPTWGRLPIAGQYLFVYILLPVIYPVCLIWCRHRRQSNAGAKWPQVALLSLAGLFLLIEVGLSPNWLRIYTISMPGLILTIWFLNQAGKLRCYALGLSWAVVVCLGLQQIWAKHHHHLFIVMELPAGSVAADPVAYEKLSWLREHTSPGQFFFQAAWPGVYLPLDLRNPVFLDVVTTNDETRPEYVEAMIPQLEAKQVHYILWARKLDGPDPRNPGQDHLSVLRAYLHSRYRLVRVFSDQDEVWERE